jgi:hypothetical protein
MSDYTAEMDGFSKRFWSLSKAVTASNEGDRESDW